MFIYLVRHGESDGNRDRIHQGSETKLTEIGLSQAKLLAHRLNKININLILASSHRRAIQTAQQIQKKISKKLETSSLFKEFDWPKEIQGKKINDPEAIKVRQLMKQHQDDADWRYSDEENYSDLLSRVDQAIKKLSQADQDNVLLVSHCFFLKLLVFRIFFPDVTNKLSIVRQHANRFLWNNTGITLLEYLTESGSWRLHSFNDLAHLG